MVWSFLIRAYSRPRFAQANNSIGHPSRGGLGKPNSRLKLVLPVTMRNIADLRACSVRTFANFRETSRNYPHFFPHNSAPPPLLTSDSLLHLAKNPSGKRREEPGNHSSIREKTAVLTRLFPVPGFLQPALSRLPFASVHVPGRRPRVRAGPRYGSRQHMLDSCFHEIHGFIIHVFMWLLARPPCWNDQRQHRNTPSLEIKRRAPEITFFHHSKKLFL